MKRGHKIAIAVLAAATIIAVAVFAWPRQQEPLYQGKTLTYWLITYEKGLQHAGGAQDHEAAKKAVRSIGAQAVPVLLAWADYSGTPQWRMRLLGWYSGNIAPHTGVSSTAYKIIVGSGEDRAEMAMAGFWILGSDARSAVGELTRRMNRGQERAAIALAYIGQDGIPPLLAALGDPRFTIRWAVVRALGVARNQGTNVNATVAALVNCLHDPDSRIATAAADSLGGLALAPEPAVSEMAVPALINTLKSPDPGLRDSAITALSQYQQRARAAVLPLLNIMVDDPEEYVRTAATNALTFIVPDAGQTKQRKQDSH